jgi:hypothetical protein
MKLLILFAFLILFQINSFAQVVQLSDTSYKINGTAYQLEKLGLTQDEMANLQAVLSNQEKMEMYSTEFMRIQAEVLNDSKKKVKADSEIAAALGQPQTLKTRRDRDLYFDEMTRKVIQLQENTKLNMDALQNAVSQNNALTSLLSQVQKSDSSYNTIRKLRN